jgi:heme exporter protein C
MSPRILAGIACLLVAALAAGVSLALGSWVGGATAATAFVAAAFLQIARGLRDPRPLSAPAPLAYSAVGGLAIALLLAALWAIFAVAPVERQMGIVQKIFYFHVASAYAMYAAFTVAAVGSIGYLIRRRDRWDALAVAGAEVGLLFCTIVLVTGPLWARKAWGVYWTWDPRLTTTLLVGLIYTAFVVLRSLGGAGEAEKRFAAGLAIVGSAVLPVIHDSVRRWRGQHPTVITRAGGGLHPDMVPALMISFAAFTALVAFLWWARFRAERARQDLAALETEAAARGLLEEA